MTQYTGNQTTLGYSRVYVFDANTGTGATQASFVKTIPTETTVAGSTSAYVTAGGAVHGTTFILSQYIGNEAYESYARTISRTFTVLEENGGITTTVQTFSPDPRIQFSLYGVGGFTGATGFTANHMDHVAVAASNGVTYEGFVGRIAYNQDDPGVAAVGNNSFLLELVAYGRSGGVDAEDDAYTMTSGATFVNLVNGNTAAVINHNAAYRTIDINSYKEKILGQASRRLDGNIFVGSTIGDASQSQAVFYNPNDSRLINFTSTLLPAFAHGASGATHNVLSEVGVGGIYAAGRQEKIFTMLAAVTGDIGHVDKQGTNAIFGVTFNAMTGGSQGGSAFEEFAHQVLHQYAKIQNAKGQVTFTIVNKSNLNDIDEITL